MKRYISITLLLLMLTIILASCSSIPTADIENPSPYAMFISLDVPGKLTSPMYYVKGQTIKKIDDGLYGLLINQDAFVYLKQTAEMDNPELMYKNLKTDKTVKLITPDQFGTMIGMLISPHRKKIVVHIWPDGIATGNNLFAIIDTNNILRNPTKLNISMLSEGKIYSTIKWIAAIGDDGSIVYVGSNGAPDEGIVYRDSQGNEKLIAKYKENGEFDEMISDGIHPPYSVASIDGDNVYLLGKSGVWVYSPQTGSLTLKYPLKYIPSQGLWVDENSKKLIVWGFKIGKASFKIYQLDGTLVKTASDIRISDPRIINGKVFAIGAVKEKTIYSYTIGELYMETSTPTLNRMFISQNDIKWWDITAEK